MLRFFAPLALCVVSLAATGISQPALAQERSAVRHDLAADTFTQARRILVFRPRIRVGEQSTGGMFEPRADWTELARSTMATALRDRQALYGNVLVEAPEAYGEQARRLDEYMSLFGATASSIITYQFFPGNRLETKKADNRAERFEWSLGPGVSQLPGAADADYGLFIFTEDQFGSTGRKVLQVFAALGGVSVQSGVHAGYAALIDLRTGNVLWINADFQMGGDVREAEGAARRMEQLFEEFPIAATVAPPAVVPPAAPAAGSQ